MGLALGMFQCHELERLTKGTYSIYHRGLQASEHIQGQRIKGVSIPPKSMGTGS